MSPATRPQSIGPSSGSVTVDRERNRVAEGEQPAVDRHVDGHRREVLPTVIVVFADVLLPLESVTVRRAV